MYKLIRPYPGVSEPNIVLRLLDNVFIPFDRGNTDYQEYLAWLAQGNTPEPADEASE